MSGVSHAERRVACMTVKDFNPASESGTSQPPGAAANSETPVSLEELLNRQKAAMVHLSEANSAFDSILEETIGAVDQSMTEWKKVADEVKSQAASKAVAVMAEGQAQAKTIMIEAESDGNNAAMTKVNDLIEDARSTAGRIARPDHEESPSLTEEIWAALEASIEPYLHTLLDDLGNLEQETKESNEQEQLRKTSVNAGDTEEAVADAPETSEDESQPGDAADSQPEKVMMSTLRPSRANRDSMRF